MILSFEPSFPEGRVSVPASKSAFHRALFCAAFAEGLSRIRLPSAELGADCLATAECLRNLGASIEIDGKQVEVRGISPEEITDGAVLPVGESATTLRLLLPILLMRGVRCRIIRSGSLCKRSLSAYEELFDCDLSGEGDILLDGIPRKPKTYGIDGSGSSQYISGMLFAIVLSGEEKILLTSGQAVSAPYIAMTVAWLEKAGVRIDIRFGAYYIYPPKRLTPLACTLPPDASSALPFMAMSRLFNKNLCCFPCKTGQADELAFPALEALDADFTTVDLNDMPDAAPVLMAFAALRYGGEFLSIHRLFDKESNRAEVMAEELAKCGIQTAIDGDRMLIAPMSRITCRPDLSSHGDHRIAMALSLILLRIGGSLSGAEAIEKSFPSYFDICKSIHCIIQTKAR